MPRKRDFLTKANGAVFRKGQGPPSLYDFAMEIQFWKRLGLTSEALDRQPWKKVVEYSTYIELLLQKEAMERAQQKG